MERSLSFDLETINGYDKLTDENRNLFDKFIVNFYNAWGIEARATIKPIAINYVRENEYLGKENKEDDFYISFRTEVFAIHKDGNEVLLHDLIDEENKHLSTELTEHKEYLRFEYEIYSKPTWQHVINEHEWY
jgi:hypothetical protein